MDNQVIRVVSALCRAVGTPRAVLVERLVRAGEFSKLQELRCIPSDYVDSETYFADALVTDLLRKCDLPTDVDKEKAAVDTFFECEKQCATTNARLTRYLPGRTLLESPADVAVDDFIGLWRKEVNFVLGNLPDTLTPRFSGGATYADTGLLKTTPDKMSSVPTLYPETQCLLLLWERTAWSRALMSRTGNQYEVRPVDSNIFFTVPKDGTKFRGCCKEASIPLGYQLDVGRILKVKLLKIGIDLKRGQMIHRRLAKEASVYDHLATIDMSNASDTMCRVLPKLVLDDGWWELLNSLRAPKTQICGKKVRLEKFSSMGNGFTFELESLLFATMARCVIITVGGNPDTVRCYGDDLIVPSEHYIDVVAALRMFGFTPNMKKTFAKGPFRESCGGDFWLGEPVRAHFIEELPNEPQQWISLCNGLRRVCQDSFHTSLRWLLVSKSWLRALDPIPSSIRRCIGPSSLGDTVIHDDPSRWQQASPPRSISERNFVGRKANEFVYEIDTWDVRWYYAYVPIPVVLKWDNWFPAVQLACCTLSMPSAGVTPRGGISGYSIRRIPSFER